MEIYEVISRKQRKEFTDFTKKHYKDDPNWINPLDSETESVFDPQKNICFTRGEAIRWLLRNNKGETIGRVAAFIDNIRREAYKYPTGGLGYFEVIEDYKAAELLFDTAINWLKERGIEAIDGPINFGENDTNWGLLVEGKGQPTFGMQYHKQYYKAFFETYGFKNFFDQYSYLKNIAEVDVFPERFMRIADWISKRPGYSFDHFKFSNASKYVNDVVEIYNETWAEFKEDFTPLNPDILYDSLKKTKAFLDEELIWFAYHDDKPIAFFMLYPDLNRILRHINGKLNLLGILKFLYYKKKKEMTRIRAAAAGVHPKYQNSGVESAIFLQLYNVFMKKRWYKELELSWVGDFNPKMISMYEAIGAEKAKVHTTYRFLVDRDAEFVRYKDEMDVFKDANAES